jgi:hypothetical protein
MGVTIGPGNTLVVSAPGPQGPAGAGGGGSISDGDKGDITVSNSGATWSVDAGAISTAKIADDAVTFAKLQNITGPSLIGRSGSAGTGSPELIGLAAALTINGSKQLDLAAAVVAAATTVTAGTGLTGGGDLSANRTFTLDFATSGVSSTTKAVRADDSRLSDSRTPSAHTHDASDISVGTLNIARVPTGTSGSTVCIGNDSRLSDARTPTAHTHGLTDSYVGHIETPTARTYYIEISAPVARTITRLDFATSAGTVDLTLTNGLSTIYTADGLGTTQTTVTSGLTNTSISAGGTIRLVLDAVSTPADLWFSIRYTAATGAIS